MLLDEGLVFQIISTIILLIFFLPISFIFQLKFIVFYLFIIIIFLKKEEKTGTLTCNNIMDFKLLNFKYDDNAGGEEPSELIQDIIMQGCINENTFDTVGVQLDASRVLKWKQ